MKSYNRFWAVCVPFHRRHLVVVARTDLNPVASRWLFAVAECFRIIGAFSTAFAIIVTSGNYFFLAAGVSFSLESPLTTLNRVECCILFALTVKV